MPQGGQIKILSDDQIEQIHLERLIDSLEDGGRGAGGAGLRDSEKGGMSYEREEGSYSFSLLSRKRFVWPRRPLCYTEGIRISK